MKKILFPLLLFLVVITSCSEVNSLASTKPTTTEKPKLTSIPTATKTALPTKTLTPTIAPPEVIEEYLENPKIILTDDFSNLNGWYTEKRFGSIKNSGFEFIGHDYWESALIFKKNFFGSQGIIIDFMITGNHKQYKTEFVFTTGTWETDTFRQFGLYIGKSPRADLFQGANAIGGPILNGNLLIKPDKWFRLLMTVGKDGQFLVLVWDPEDPSNRLVYFEKLSDKWENKTWEFMAKGDEGGDMFVDNFRLLSFDGYQ